VQQGPTGSVVYALGAGDKVEVRDVKATGWQGSQWLIEEGLRQGDRVIVSGMQRLAPGAQVKPVAVASGGAQPVSPSGSSAVAADAAAPETRREGTP
jgi:membrane fusion protein (multidrug efflux system)